MKKALKLTLAVAMMAMAMPSMAQKFGYVDSREIAMALPEVATIKENLQKLGQELSLRIEEMQVEFNRKVDEYQKTEATLTDTMKRLKEEEIQSLGQRIQELQEAAQAQMAEKEAELTRPLIEKATAAVEAVMKAQGLAAVFETMALVSMDKAQMVDVTPLAKKHLGIAE
jgi:outer membrane protein